MRIESAVSASALLFLGAAGDVPDASDSYEAETDAEEETLPCPDAGVSPAGETGGSVLQEESIILQTRAVSRRKTRTCTDAGSSCFFIVFLL